MPRLEQSLLLALLLLLGTCILPAMAQAQCPELAPVRSLLRKPPADFSTTLAPLGFTLAATTTERTDSTKTYRFTQGDCTITIYTSRAGTAETIRIMAPNPAAYDALAQAMANSPKYTLKAPYHSQGWDGATFTAPTGGTETLMSRTSGGVTTYGVLFKTN